MSIIRSTTGYECLVDEQDFLFVNQWSWNTFTKSSRVYFRRCGERVQGVQETILLHRIIAERSGLLVIGRMVDHKDGDTLNNKRMNLRVATSTQNQANTSIRVDNTSGYKGVSFDRLMRKWKAQIQINKQKILLGYYDTPEQAAFAYNVGAIRVFGDFAKINEI